VVHGDQDLPGNRLGLDQGDEAQGGAALAGACGVVDQGAQLHVAAAVWAAVDLEAEGEAHKLAWDGEDWLN
jgi:hypothetical protein